MNFRELLLFLISRKPTFSRGPISIGSLLVCLAFAGSASAQDNQLDWGNKNDGAILDNTGGAYDWIDNTSGNGYTNGDNTTSATYDNVDGTDRDITFQFDLLKGSSTNGDSSLTLLDLFNADGDRNGTQDGLWNSGDDYIARIQPDEGVTDDKILITLRFSEAVNEITFNLYDIDKSPFSAPDGSTLTQAIDNGTEINEINFGWIDQLTMTGTRIDGQSTDGSLSSPVSASGSPAPGEFNPYENQSNPLDYVDVDGNTATGRWTVTEKNESDPTATPENNTDGDGYWDPSEKNYYSNMGDITVTFDAPVTEIQILYENVWNDPGSERDGGEPPTGELEPYYDAHSNDFGLGDIGFTPFEDSQVVFDTTAEGGTLDGTMDANGGSDTLDQGSLFLNSAVAVNVDINSTSNQATTYTVTADPTLTVTGDDGSISEIGGADETDTLGLTLDTSTLGNVTGTATLDNTDATSDPSSNGATAPNRFGIYDDNDAITVSADVYAHSNASFASGSDDNDTAINFGTITDGGAGAQSDSVNLYNLPATDVPNGDSTPNTDATSIAYTVDLGYSVDSITGADAAAFDSTATGEIAPNASDAVSVSFDPTDPSVDHLGTYTATVNIAPEDTNLNADGFAGPDTGANLNDSSNLTVDVSAVVADSQVTFDTDTTDGAGSNGQQTNGATTNVTLGNFFQGATAETTVGVNNTGNESTTYDVTVGSGDALINGATGGILNESAIGQITPTEIVQDTTFAAGLDTSVTGSISGTIDLNNDDSTTAISGLDQGNGTGAGYGAEDSTDTLSLAANVYEHANSSFTGGNLDTNALTIDFGTVGADTGTYDSGFSIYNLAGLDADYTISYETTGVTGDTTFLYTDLASIDDLGAGDSNNYLATFDTTGLDPGFYTTTIIISGLDDDEYIALVNSLSGGADLPTGYNPGDLTLNLQGEVVPEPSTAILLAVFGVMALFRRPRRAVKA